MFIILVCNEAVLVILALMLVLYIYVSAPVIPGYLCNLSNVTKTSASVTGPLGYISVAAL